MGSQKGKLIRRNQTCLLGNNCVLIEYLIINTEGIYARRDKLGRHQ